MNPPTAIAPPAAARRGATVPAIAVALLATVLAVVSALPAAGVDDPAPTAPAATPASVPVPTAPGQTALGLSGQDPSGLDQTVDADEATVEGREVIDLGHVDLGPRFVGGAWRLQARDDREIPPVWRFPGDVVFRVTDAGVLTVPDDPDYAFLRTAPGGPVHVVPQTQLPDVVWLGWNTQDPEVVERIERGASLTLRAADGPGALLLFLQEGVSGAPNVLWDSAAALPQSLWMQVNTHTHANWVFTEPGIYRLAVEVHTDLVDGTAVTDVATLRFAVGDDTDPRAAFDLPDLAVPAPVAGNPAPEPSTVADESGLGRVVIGIAVGGTALAAVLVALLARSRRARAGGHEGGLVR